MGGDRAAQRIVIAINKIDLVLDWSCSQAMIGDWAGAADRAAPVLDGAGDVVGEDWPPTWQRDYHGHLLLLAALAGKPLAGLGLVEVDDAVAALASAIRAARSGRGLQAARLAEGLTLPELTPAGTRLLALSLAGVRPEVTEARAQAVVDAVRDHDWPAVAPGLAVSISVGVHHGGPDQLAGLASDADKRLYQAKSSGRGRVAS